MFSFKKKLEMPSAAEALPGRPTPIPTAREHFVISRPLKGPYPEGLRDRDVRHGLLLGRRAQVLGAGRRHPRHRRRLCRRPDAQPDLRGGLLAAAPATTRSCWWSTIRRRSPTSSCSRRSGRTTIRPRACARATTSARSTAPASTSSRRRSAKPPKPPRRCTSKALKARRFDAITTEILDAPQFYFAEDYHQQYLAKNPMGYCGLGGTGVSCPIGTGESWRSPRRLDRDGSRQADRHGARLPHRGPRAFSSGRGQSDMDERCAATERAMRKIELFIEAVMFQSRWMLAPFYLGLAFCLLLLLVSFPARARRISSSRFRSRPNPTSSSACWA